jgi:prepilin-type N-terminal cleavage/methylation domain-containing protein
MKRNRFRKGFSLLEVLFAVMITATCGALLAATIPIANSSRARANYLTLSTTLAQKQLEAVRAIGYANLTADQMFTYGLIDSRTAVATNTWPCCNIDAAQNDSPARILPRGAATVKVEQVDVDLKRITVEVTYRDQDETKRVTLATLVANL